MLDNAKQADCSIDFPEIVQSLSFAEFEWGSNLLAVGGEQYVSVGVCKFKEEEKDENLTYTELYKCIHGARVTSISWSMETSLVILPKIVKFATGSSDHKVRIFTSDLKGQDTKKELEGHRGPINAVAFDTHKGENCASVSDDCTCRVWGSEGSNPDIIHLGSPGMAVCWHTDEPTKILVGLKSGLIRIYSLHSSQPIMSFDCGSSPLLSVDWSPLDCVSVVAVTTSQCFLFDTSRSSRPISSFQSANDGFRQVRWCRCRDDLIATTGRPGQQMKVFNLTHGQVVLAGNLHISNSISWHHRLPVLVVGGDMKVVLAGNLQISNSISWHHRLPVLAVGGDNKVHFWFINSCSM